MTIVVYMTLDKVNALGDYPGYIIAVSHAGSAHARCDARAALKKGAIFELPSPRHLATPQSLKFCLQRKPLLPLLHSSLQHVDFNYRRKNSETPPVTCSDNSRSSTPVGRRGRGGRAGGCCSRFYILLQL